MIDSFPVCFVDWHGLEMLFVFATNFMKLIYFSMDDLLSIESCLTRSPYFHYTVMVRSWAGRSCSRACLAEHRSLYAPMKESLYIPEKVITSRLCPVPKRRQNAMETKRKSQERHNFGR